MLVGRRTPLGVTSPPCRDFRCVIDSSAAEGVRRNGSGRSAYANRLEAVLQAVGQGRFELTAPAARVRSQHMVLADPLSRWEADGERRFWDEAARLVILAPAHPAEDAGPLRAPARAARAAARLYRSVVTVQRRRRARPRAKPFRLEQGVGLPPPLQDLVAFIDTPPVLQRFSDPTALRNLVLQLPQRPLAFLFDAHIQNLPLIPPTRPFGHARTARARQVARRVLPRDGGSGCASASSITIGAM